MFDQESNPTHWRSSLSTIHYLIGPDDQRIDLTVSPGESVVSCFLRNKVPISFGCKQGVCQACMLRLVEGTVSARSQQDLRDSLRAQGYFLACRCYPSSDLTIEPRKRTVRSIARIVALDWMRETIARVCLKSEALIPYRPGQFVNLILPGGVTRSYSLVSLPGEQAPENDATGNDVPRNDVPRNHAMEIHVRVFPGGVMSGWLREGAAIGASLGVKGPFGDCFYVAENQSGGLMLAGNGTGVGPLWGIARDALRSAHSGPIWLFHGVLTADGLYLDRELRELAAEFPQFHYVPVVLKGVAPDGGSCGSLDVVMSETMAKVAPSLAGWRTYLCGDRDLVMSMRRRCFGAGVAIHDIHADEFLPAGSSIARQ